MVTNTKFFFILFNVLLIQFIVSFELKSITDKEGLTFSQVLSPKKQDPDLKKLTDKGKELLSLKNGEFANWLQKKIIKNKDVYFHYNPDDVTEKTIDNFLVRFNPQRKNYNNQNKISKFYQKKLNEAIALFSLPGRTKPLTLFPNQFPYLTNHALLIPDIFGNVPQVLDEKILSEALEFLNYFKDSKIRLGCNLKQEDMYGNLQEASVDHFHWQLFSNKLPVENRDVFTRKNISYYKNTKFLKIQNYPLDAYLFQSKSINELIPVLTLFLKKLNKERLIYNLLVNYDKEEQILNIFVILRKFKQGFGILEACGCMRLVETEEESSNIQIKDILGKQKIDFEFQGKIDRYVENLALKLSLPKLKNYKVIKKFDNNSEAELYLIERTNGKKEVVKLASKEKYGSGNEKLKKESLHLNYLHNIFSKNYLKATTMEYNDAFAMIMKYIKGKTLEEYFCNPDLTIENNVELLKLALTIMLNIYSQDFFYKENNFLQTAHLERFKDRLEIAKNKSCKLCSITNTKPIYINGTEYDSPYKIIKLIEKDHKLLNLFSPPFLGLCAHGDFIPSNILLKKKGEIKFIDVRGCIDTKRVPKWDYIYDIGKLKFYFSSFKPIIDNKFKIEQLDKNKFNFNLLTNDEIWQNFHFTSQNLIEYLSSIDEMKNFIKIDPFWEKRLLFSEAINCLAETASRTDRGEENQAIATYLMGTILLNQIKNDLFKTQTKKIDKIDLRENSNIPSFYLNSKDLTLDDQYGTIELQKKYIHNLKNTTFLASSFSRKSEPNKLLYKAKKDLLPIREKNDYEKQWRFDLTVYPQKPFKSTELNRSCGHLNGKEEIEIFQVWHGEVRIYYQVELDNKIKCFYQDLKPKQYSIIPPGAWHCTHVLQGPAVVANICNREGFFGQENKPYSGEGAFTFCYKEGFDIFPVLNPKFKNKILGNLTKVEPDILPKKLTNKYKNLTILFSDASAKELEELAQYIFNKN